MYTTLITAEQLLTLQQSSKPLMVFDCSFELMQPTEGEQQYLRAHIAGAQRADLDRHLSAKHPAEAVNGGRHPLPTREAFAAWLASLGFTADMQAVVYDRQGANYCGRLWWMLKWVGHEAVAVLDGGLQAWEAANGAIETGTALPRVASAFHASTPKAQLATTDTVLQQLGRPTQTLVDARGTPRFRGEVEPLDPVAGHIPGALNRPFNLNLGPDGRFKPAEELRAEFTALLAGRDPASVVHHCGSGVSAVPNLLAMEIAGLGRGALYAGSWSEWCSDPARPMAQG
ncbi:MAG: sulfurtransferase [Pseudomonadota bacterium]|nr:sulfurtransferase [Pseudomonadota bacterium]